MDETKKQELLRSIPSVGHLVESETVRAWLNEVPESVVHGSVRDAADKIRSGILNGTEQPTDEEHILSVAKAILLDRTNPHIRRAINATGIILHTGLGRSVWPSEVVEAVSGEMDGYVTLAYSRETGKRQERDKKIEYIITEITGAEAGMVVNNNAAATLLALAAIASEKEVVVSRGQLIEIGGSFRLPDVMKLGGATLVEIGTTNRTHLRDYRNAVTENTGAFLRVHPSNYRVVGFSGQPGLEELVELAREHDIPLIDDLGAGALVDLEKYGLPHEPTIQESIACGADLIMVSTDKLIGGPQGGMIIGKRKYVDMCRKHPLYRAMRADKSCLMALERTLMLFRDPDTLTETHPLYRMLATKPETLRSRGEALVAGISKSRPAAETEVIDTVAYLGSGSLPMEEIASVAVAIVVPGLEPEKLACKLRLDDACIFPRVEKERVLFDMRTITDRQVTEIADAVGRAE